MADGNFSLAGTVTVDASQAIGAVQSATAGVEKLTAATGQGSAAASAAAAADKLRADATGQSTAAAAKAAQEELNLSKIRQAVQKQAVAQYSEQKRLAKELADTQIAAARRSAMAMQGAGVQAGDFFQQLSLGTPIAMAFGQQAQQMAGQLAMMEGKAAAVGRFLMGPWGIAITVAATMLGNLAGGMIGAGDAAETQEDATKKLTDAIAALRQASGLANRTAEESLRISAAVAAGHLREAETVREKTRAKLADARADLVAAQNRMLDPTTASEFGNGAVQSASMLEQRIEALDRLDRQQVEGVITLRGQIAANERWFQVQQSVAAATSVAARETQAYERVQAKLKSEVEAGLRTEESATAVLLEAARRRDTAISAETASRRAATAASRELVKAQRDEAKSLLDIAEAGNRAMLALTKDANSGDFGKTVRDALAAQAKDSDHEELFPRLRELTSESISEGARDGWKRFHDDGLVAVQAIAQEIGGQLGGALGNVASLASSRGRGRGGGTLGAIVGGLSSMGGLTDAQKRLTGYDNTPGMKEGMPKAFGDIFGDSFKDKLNEPFKALSDKFSEIFSGPNGGKFAAGAGKAFAGAAQGSIASGVAGALGIKQSQTGAQIGGAIGSFFGPFGGAIGGLLGGTLGGMLSKPKTGSSTISSSGGAISVGAGVGSSAGLKKAAETRGNSVGDAIEALVAQLGGDLGNFSVSLGQRDKKFTVDPTGANRTKGAGVQKFKDESEAVQAALADAIRDGAVAGVSPRVQAVLNQYADNLNKAVAEAMKVKGLEDLLANDKNPFATMFRDFEQMAQQRADAAKKYGFDVLEIERINGEQRAKLVQETLERSTASIRQVRDDLMFGSRAEGSYQDRRSALTTERDRLAVLARGGDQAATDKLAAVAQQLFDLTKEGYGSTAALAATKTETVSLLDELMKLTEDRIKAAQAGTGTQGEATTAQLTEANASLDDLVGLTRETRDAIQQLGAQLAGRANDGLLLDRYTRTA